MKQTLTQEKLHSEAVAFVGAGGVSAENRHFGFCPAFMNKESGECVLSCSRNGAPAAIHQFDGLPDAWVAMRDAAGRPVAVKAAVVAGFVRDGHFFTREQAAQLVQWEMDKAGL